MEVMKNKEKWIFRLVQWATIFVLLGRAYQHWFWDAPYRSLLWDQELMSPILERFFHVSWTEYAANIRIDQGITLVMKIIGSVFGLGAIVAAFPRFFPKRVWKLWLGLSAWLVFLAFLYYKEQNYQFGQFIEYALQAATPLFFYVLMEKGELNISWGRWMRVATALTFTGHGLYAVGFYPRPGHFTTMAINALNIPVDWANQFLWAAGILDFIAAAWVLLIIPGRGYALAYCIFWGFLTSLARPWSNFFPELWAASLHQWLFEFIYRTPHFLIPMAILLLGPPPRRRLNRKHLRQVQ